MSKNSGHGTGTTLCQMASAPQGAFYVWCNYDLTYPRELAVRIGRSDLRVVVPTALSTGVLTGSSLDVVVDHAAELTIAQQKGLREYQHKLLFRKQGENISSKTFGKRQIRGKFWMVQSDVISPESHKDRFGRDTVDWPGKSIFTKESDAVTACEELAKKNPDRAYFVMKAITMVQVKAPLFERVHLK